MKARASTTDYEWPVRGRAQKKMTAKMLNEVIIRKKRADQSSAAKKIPRNDIRPGDFGKGCQNTIAMSF